MVASASLGCGLDLKVVLRAFFLNVKYRPETPPPRLQAKEAEELRAHFQYWKDSMRRNKKREGWEEGGDEDYWRAEEPDRIVGARDLDLSQTLIEAFFIVTLLILQFISINPSSQGYHSRLPYVVRRRHQKERELI